MTNALGLATIARCFEGGIPAVIATASADGTPNITYLSRVLAVDDERVALSNQFFSKTAQNLVENPRASLLLVDPDTHDEYRLTLVYERTERRGPLFERLRSDVDAIAAMSGMQDVFRLRAADIYRVVDLMPLRPHSSAAEPTPTTAAPPGALAIGEMCARIARCSALDVLVATTIDGLASVLGYQHVHLLLLDEQGRRLYNIASRGYDVEAVGAEVLVGDGVIGMAAAQNTPMRTGYLHQMAKYSRSIRRSWEESGGVHPGREIALSTLDDAGSILAVPAMAVGHLVGVIVAESTRRVMFGPEDEAALVAVASLFASTYETLRAEEHLGGSDAVLPTAGGGPPASEAVTHVRFFAVDGSTFLDGDYLIKGVAGRILWSLLRQYDADGRTEFTNKELRLDPSLEMPGFKDNLESRLILLTRRLAERDAPIRIERTGRGRFRLLVDTALRLDATVAGSH